MSWAAKRSELAKRRAQGRSLDPRGRSLYINDEEEEEEDDDDGGYYGSDNDDMITIQSMIDGSTDRKKGQSEEDPRMPHGKREKEHAESPMVEKVYYDDGNGGWITNKYGSTDQNRGQSEEDLKMPHGKRKE